MSIGKLWLFATLAIVLAVGTISNGFGTLRGAGSKATAPDVTVTTSSPTDNASTTFTITVSGLEEGTKWRDFHMTPISGKKFPEKFTPPAGTVPVIDTNAPSTSNTQIWNFGRDSGGTGIHIYTGTDSTTAPGFGDGTYTITVPWKNPTGAKQRAIEWQATKNGSSTVGGSSNIIKDSTGTQAPNVPQVKVTANDESDLKAPINTSTSFACATEREFSGYSYEIYSSTRLVADYSDALGIGIDSTNSPIPASWNVSIEHATGSIDAEGLVTPSPAVVVPNDAELVSKVFYVVFAVKLNGSIFYSSSPIPVTISQS